MPFFFFFSNAIFKYCIGSRESRGKIRKIVMDVPQKGELKVTACVSFTLE